MTTCKISNYVFDTITANQKVKVNYVLPVDLAYGLAADPPCFSV